MVLNDLFICFLLGSRAKYAKLNGTQVAVAAVFALQVEPILMKLIVTSLAAVWAMASLASAGTLNVDQQASWLKVDVKATAHSFTGGLDKFEATVVGDDTTLEPKTAVLRWNFSDLNTGDDKRDKEMVKWLETGSHPKGEFRMNKTWKDGGKTYAQGVLSIHGVTKTVSFPVTAKRDGDKVAIDGEVWLDYQDFSLPIIRMMAVMTVDPKLKVRFHLVGSVK
jgi:polyisoprenoid-binding protein YceI